MYRFEEIKNNPDLQHKLGGAMEIRHLIREWFREHGFLEVETPALTRFPGQEPYLSPFEVVVRDERGESQPAYLITSPEYALKKLLATGYPKIFELARVFRNYEPQGGLHNPEFTMLEWYRAGVDYQKIMDDVEQLVFFIYQKLPTITQLPNYPITSYLAPPWEHLSVREAFQKYAEIELDQELGRADFDSWFFKVFLSKIEPRLGQDKPTILYDYPASMAALARLKDSDPGYAERFEVYIKGMEIANAFSELVDADEQRRRFEEEQKIRQASGKTVFPIDEELLAALHEVPSAAGIALGVDRLTMVFLDAKSIRDVIYFPWMRD